MNKNHKAGMVYISFWVAPELAEKLRRMMEAQGKSRSDILRKLIRMAPTK